ncbi:MAG: methyl-accepting chemotaxis protein [Chloroflexi bacterium]|nr:methyl-accepting chemotaxis protein [Chloroflexota bacterium]
MDSRGLSESNETNQQAMPMMAAMTSGSSLVMAAVAALPVLFMGLVMNADAGFLLLWAVGSLFGGWLVGVAIHLVTRSRASHVLNEYAQTLDQIVRGDLRQRLNTQLDARSSEEKMLLRLGNSVNRMLDRLQDVVTEISQALKRMEADTQEILDATAQQISMANEQDDVVTETTATVNEVRATVTETAERAQSVAETAQVSVDTSRKGIDSVSQAISGMELIRRRVEDIADNILVLSEHTQQIGEIIATVNSLADQSRMLALNASVEAARAGEEGKGFAVVALEVRNLADQNRDATVQVREILGEIQRATNAAVMVTEEGSKGVDHGQMLVNSAGDSIRNLSHAIEEAAMAAMQIAASTRQQTIGMDQLTQAMRMIKHATTETLNSTMQVKASVQNLREVASRINAVLSGLKI